MVIGKVQQTATEVGRKVLRQNRLKEFDDSGSLMTKRLLYYNFNSDSLQDYTLLKSFLPALNVLKLIFFSSDFKSTANFLSCFTVRLSTITIYCCRCASPISKLLLAEKPDNRLSENPGGICLRLNLRTCFSALGWFLKYIFLSSLEHQGFSWLKSLWHCHQELFSPGILSPRQAMNTFWPFFITSQENYRSTSLFCENFTLNHYKVI